MTKDSSATPRGKVVRGSLAAISAVYTHLCKQMLRDHEAYRRSCFPVGIARIILHPLGVLSHLAGLATVTVTDHEQ